ncbi:MAG: (4Fe-4S)-binding protein, partial [Candidatus Hydrothermarchaeota archaeon]
GVESQPVELLVPRINEDKCTYCGRCAEFCQYNALFVAGETALVFPELCHSCGGCKLVCPEGAIEEIPRAIGEILRGKHRDVELVYGRLSIGEPLAVPIISKVKEQAKEDGVVVIDAPPGSACPVVEAVHGSDFCLLVTEPTPFGLHDLKVAVEVVKQLNVPMGVVVNFAGIGDAKVYEFCEEEGLPGLLEIPFDRRIAELYSRGIPFTQEMAEWKPRFQKLLYEVERLAK